MKSKDLKNIHIYEGCIKYGIKVRRQLSEYKERLGEAQNKRRVVKIFSLGERKGVGEGVLCPSDDFWVTFWVLLLQILLLYILTMCECVANEERII